MDFEQYFPKKILIVDDSSTMRILVKRFLANRGYKHLYEACDGVEALKMILESSPKDPFEMTLLDWNMPNMTGLELLKRLRKSEDENLKILPVVMVTCEIDRSQVELALNTGANNYIAKPFKKSILFEKLERTFEKVSSKEDN